MIEQKSKYQIEAEGQISIIVKNNLWRYIYFVLAVCILSVFLNILLLYAILYKYPANKFLWTSDARSVCAATPLTKPTVTPALVKDFANRAALDLNSFDYVNWRRTLSTALDQYFTPAGRSRYTQAFEKSGILEKVRKNYYTLTAVSSGYPVLLNEGVVDNRYQWTIQVPIIVYYRTNTEVLPESRVLTMTLVSVDPSPLNPNGIAIDGVISQQHVLDRNNLN